MHCTDHGYIDKPQPQKKAAEGIAVAHAKTEHDGNANVETPAP